MTDRLLPIVWGETQALTPADGSAATMDRLYAVVAAMAIDAETRGLDRRFTRGAAPAALSVRDADYRRAATLLTNIRAQRYAGDALPGRAVLWEMTAAGLPRLDGGGPPAPPWILDADVLAGGDFNTGGGTNLRRYRLYQSAEKPDAGAMAFFSAVTNTGLVSPTSTPLRKTAWIVGYAGLLIFLAGCVLSISTGQSKFRGAESAISAYGLTYSATANDKLPSWAGCPPLPTKPDPTKHSLNSKTTNQLCATDESGLPSDLAGLLMTTGGFALIAIGLGLGTKQRVTGIWIDGRNRVSLARAQVTLWTIVVLGSCTSYALLNAGAQPHAAGFDVFPVIPSLLWAALGITTISPAVSALILNAKSATSPDSITTATTPGITFFGAGGSGLDINDNSRDASIADIFMGEENANADIVDLSRLQNVIITLMLVIVYFWSIISQVDAISLLPGQADFTNFRPLPELPHIGRMFTTLLLASHAAYLSAKAYDNKSPQPSDQSGG